MSTPSASIRELARRLLAAEAANQSLVGAQGHEVVRICEKLRISLTGFVGADGFTALLRRALGLARAEVPSLQSVTVTAEGRLEGIAALPAHSTKDAEAALQITAHLLQLLVTFIGESIALRLVRGAWPNAVGRFIEHEDLK